PGCPVPPSTPLLNPADATVAFRSLPPGTPFATPDPKSVPRTTPWRAAPAPLATPGAALNEPTAAIVAVRVALGFGFTPSGSPNPPILGVGAELLFATVVGASLLNI